jgi:hypothetical protein
VKRIAVTTVFAAVAVASAAVQAAAAAGTSTASREPLATPSYQIVVDARLVGPFVDVSGLGAES